MTTPLTAPRDHLVRALEADLVGPFAPEDPDNSTEVLELPPSRHYLTGFLVPEFRRTESDADAEAEDELAAGSDEDEEETHGGAEASDRRKNFFPASMGLTVLLPEDAGDAISVVVRYAEYTREQNPHEGGPRHLWRRMPRRSISMQVPLNDAVLQMGIPVPDSMGIKLYGQLKRIPDTARGIRKGACALSLFIVNGRPEGDKGVRDEQYLFQVELQATCEAGFLPRPNLANESSDEWDERVVDLQFRQRYEYAVGHNVSVEVLDPAPDGDARVRRVKTTWIPRHEVHRVEPHMEPGVVVDMDRLAAAHTAAEVKACLEQLPKAYTEWIQKQRTIKLDSKEREATRDVLLKEAQEACKRIASGIELLCEHEDLRTAFTLTNWAMAQSARQRSPERYADGKAPTWRVFQLSFLLLSIAGVADPRHPDRKLVELIFFPTGGGKTEAYLGVIAFTLLLRRMRGRGTAHAGLGVAVMLRYTLRLLTLDQLGRAATLVCALEMARREQPELLGTERFSVGLWVGQSATANTLEAAAKLVNEYKNGTGPNPCPLPNCPWCREPLNPTSLTLYPSVKKPEIVRVGCINDRCPFSCGNHEDGIPVVFVDDQLYREVPCFLIGTVDKFAMMPWRGEAGLLFGRAIARKGRYCSSPVDSTPPRDATLLPEGLLPPELIVQDELHLISGPLGTMVGLYETAVSELCSRGAANERLIPKIIAATATVRRARQQIQALYGREGMRLFPPPGVDDSDTYFAYVEQNEPGRLYLGVAAPGRPLKAVLLRVYRALLAAAARQYDPKGGARQTADYYMTLAGYFNSLRELGGMRRLVEDEVQTRAFKAEEFRPVSAVGPHPWFKKRKIDDEPVELTSRESTSAVKLAKDRLSLPYTEKERVDVLLASNMISVGVDIDRLGLMVIAGQPKTTAEYIQASSRVGRQKEGPGLVVTCMNVHKPRDRSHYERFGAYHQSFYRFVEATSVTPFSGPALERGLAGMLVSMVRFATPELTPSQGAMEIGKHQSAAQHAVEAVVRRGVEQPGQDADRENQLGAELKKRADNLLDTWRELVDRGGDEPGNRTYSRFDKDRRGGKPLLFQALDRDRPPKHSKEARFQAPTSMRDVEASTHLWLQRSGRLGTKQS